MKITRIRKKYLLALNIIIAIVFTFLFYKNGIGVNLIIFEALTIPLLIYFNRPIKLNYLTITLLLSTTITLILSFTIHTNWTIFINYLLYVLLVSALSFKSIRSILPLFVETVIKIFYSQGRLLFCPWRKPKDTLPISFRKIFFFVILPILILILFFALYCWANPNFYSYFAGFVDVIIEFIEKIDITVIVLLVAGFFIANYLFIPTPPKHTYYKDLSVSNNISDISITSENLLAKFKTYNVSGIIILLVLNLLLLFYIIIDVNNVIIDFTWAGESLKTLVHKGTLVLLIAIILSGTMALLIFRGKFVHYTKNKFLKILVIIWLFFNMILCLLVFARNFWYIQYFGLTYKRIALLFFLLVTIVSLFLIIYKILLKKSYYFLLTYCSYVVLLAFVISSFVNWDIIISKYNLSHSDKVVIELNSFIDMEDSALPYLIKTKEELEEIKNQQNKISNKYNTSLLKRIKSYYFTYDKYYDKIIEKEQTFKQKYESKNVLEWNYSDYRTYKLLTQKEKSE